MCFNTTGTITQAPQLLPSEQGLQNAQALAPLELLRDFSSLFSSIPVGDTRSVTAYSDKQIPDIEATAAARRTAALNRLPPGGQLTKALADTASRAVESREAGASRVGLNAFNYLLQIATGQDVPYGQTRSTSIAPGPLDALQAAGAVAGGIGSLVNANSSAETR